MFHHLNANYPNIESQILHVKKYCNKGTIIINMYRPPGGNQSVFMEEIESILRNAHCDGPNDVYLTGDLNMDHTPKNLTDNTKNLIEMFKTYDMKQYITQPTRVTSKSKTLLDVMYIKTSKVIESFIVKSTLSDHYIIGTNRCLNYTKPQQYYITRRTYRKYSYEKTAQGCDI